MSEVEYQDYDGTWKPYSGRWPERGDDLIEYEKLGTLHGVPIRTDLTGEDQLARLSDNYLRIWEEQRADNVQVAE